MAAMSLLLRAAAAWGARRTLPSSALWSRIPLLGRAACRSGVIAPVRHGSHGGKRMFVIKTTQFYDKRFLSLLRFYISLTGIPIVVLITFVNVFIGEAELAEIPEGYVPEHWEYYQHPITRWIACYLLDSPEKEYEKAMAAVYVEMEKTGLRKKEKEARRLMKERGDGPWYHYETPSTNLIDYSYKATPDN
ncbi:NADH dehydrogenase [ubiquinone] 1 beta subcomplex subunit 5, mitochondrial [Rhineura floridana]|uniref:NADH dehydrogenase [ubiquinone] 1 beta subcomplex subunit 5, mitochondrial n=1 Tax=Rhineura floridana TaxID=261503 RepID=UPI002AC7E7BB|nr:NADH dehydrogenase [ubiquinone] 1 beta subcomplex subunit 5, mitochondrial [Rhineura floridana]